MHKKRIFLLAMATALTLGAAGCDSQGPAERAGEKIDDAVEDAGDKVEDATD